MMIEDWEILVLSFTGGVSMAVQAQRKLVRR